MLVDTIWIQLTILCYCHIYACNKSVRIQVPLGKIDECSTKSTHSYLRQQRDEKIKHFFIIIITIFEYKGIEKRRIVDNNELQRQNRQLMSLYSYSSFLLLSQQLFVLYIYTLYNNTFYILTYLYMHVYAYPSTTTTTTSTQSYNFNNFLTFRAIPSHVISITCTNIVHCTDTIIAAGIGTF